MIHTIEKVAKLARLSLTDEEKTEFAKDVEEVLNSFKVLEEIDTTNVVPSFRPISQKNILREDVVEEVLPIQTKTEKGFIIGPKTV